MDLVFVGGLFPKDEEELIQKKSKGVIQNAANVFQWNLVKGLDIANHKPTRLINAIFVSSYPKYYSSFYITSRYWKHTEGAKDTNIGFLNLPLLKRLWIRTSIGKRLELWASDGRKSKAVILYSMNSYFLGAASKLKNRYPEIHICLVCPDLTEFINSGWKSKCLNVLISYLDRRSMNKYLRQIDSFVFLTNYMSERINYANKPWITVEGLVNPEDIGFIENPMKHHSDVKTVLYTGTLDPSYGIVDLVKSFDYIDNPLICLWVCGAGEAEDIVRKASGLDRRISYFGQVSHSKVLDLQQRASLLINPRNEKNEFTKYSFPSKLMEYMLSGTPTLVFKLPGVPNEYYDYIYTIEGEGPKAIAESINRVLNNPNEELLRKAAEARYFVLSEKNYVKQAKRVLDLIKECEDE